MLFLVLFLATLDRPAGAKPFYVNYSREFEPDAFAAYDVAILSPDAKVNWKDALRPGQEVYGYLSIVEIAADAHYRAEAIRKGVPFLGGNTEWNSDLADITSPIWMDFVLGVLAPQIVEKGFHGFFLDTAESVEYLAQRYPARAAAFRAGLAKLIKALKEKYPKQKIIMNRGLQVWEAVKTEISGVLIESVVQTYNFQTKQYGAVSEEGKQWLLGQTDKLRKAGLEVYALDYADPKEPAKALEAARKLEELGFWSLVSTPELDGEILGPLKDVRRWALVLFGTEERGIEDMKRWASDSTIAQSLQMPLEYLGYEVDYVNVQFQTLPDPVDPKYSVILMDRFLRFLPDREEGSVDWLIAQKKEGRKVIVMGGVPFSEGEAVQKFLKEFQLGGTARLLQGLTEIEVAASAAAMNFETKVYLLTNRFVDIQAPPGSDIWFSVSNAPSAGKPGHRFDAVFIAPWGGALLDPYTFLRRPDYTELWLLDPFRFLEAALGNPAWPRPDVTTRNGLRMFFTHIDGDGFSGVSSVAPPKRSGEVILDRIVKKYPFPFTCSVITAEIAGQVVNQKPGDREILTRIAREMFALDKVEAASHSHTHPFFWMKNDRTVELYEAEKLELKKEFNPGELNPRREVEESVRIIDQDLVPPGKKVKLFLWSGNCRPPPEAIEAVKRMGLENMNGGDTTISRKYPSYTKVSPKSMTWDKSLQILTAQQNENVYRERWQPSEGYRSPFLGGFMHAIETFERTGYPRRLKPVNIYFHYYSADNLASLTALERLFDWATNQPLHAVTAAEYARITRDSRLTRVYETGENTWMLFNEGYSRTYYLRKSDAVPDMDRSEGVLGYKKGADGGMYVHTDGRMKAKLVLAAKPPAHLFLMSSTGAINFQEMGREAAVFEVRDVREVAVKFGGLPPAFSVSLMINGTPVPMKADEAGELELKLPSQAKVVLKRA